MHALQRGALSLGWCAFLMALMAACGFAFLFAFRDGRNIVAEAWASVQATPAASGVQRAQSAAALLLQGRESTVLRACRINGAIVYSNMDCRSDNPTARAVVLHDTHGIEAPKTPVAASAPAVPAASADTAQQKMLDTALEKSGGS